MCGEACALTTHPNNENKHVEGGLLDVKVIGGYFSTPGNGYGALDDITSYGFSLCEFCCDWLFQQFRISPHVDELHDGVEKFIPAAERVKNDDWRKGKEEFFKEYNRRAELRKK